MRGVPGTACRLRMEWWDGPLPEPGDFLRTPAGSCYLIDEVRRSRPGSKTPGVLVCTRLERHAVREGDPGVWEWLFARRDRGNVHRLA